MMNYIIGLIGDILGWLMYFCYRVLPDYFISIIVFTFGTKIVLLPVSLWVQKNITGYLAHISGNRKNAAGNEFY